MITLSGRMTPGLDEFMLRLGHLKVLSNIAAETGGSRRRVERAFAELLTGDSTAPANEIPALTEYLYRKRLCVIRAAMRHGQSEEEEDEQAVRYSDLVIEQASDGSLLLSDGTYPSLPPRYGGRIGGWRTPRCPRKWEQ